MRAADHIDLVRVRGPSTARHVRHALGRGRLSPTSLPPSAVLAVRRLAVPLAGTGRRLPPRWEQATRDALDDVRRRAVRPRQGRVPAWAEAVLFADETERRACAALALAEGERPWWSESLAAGSVAEVFGSAPRLAPAALDRLDAWGEAPRVLTAVSASDAAALLDAVCGAFGVGPSAAAAPTPLPWSDAPPLARAVHDTSHRAGPAQAALLGVGVALTRLGPRLRQPGAVDAVRQWVAEGGARRTAGPPPREASAAPDAAGPRLDAPPRARTSAVPDPEGAPAPTPPAGGDAGREGPPLPRPPTGAFGLRSASEPASPPSRAEADRGLEPAADHPAVSGPILRDTPLRFDGVATGLGGVFFLLPVMQGAGWPDACEASWRPAAEAGPWAVLEALARALLGDAYDDDPLWRALAHLDGRLPVVPAPDAAPAPLPVWLSAWARGVTSDVEARLVEALRLDGPAQIPPALLLREGTVHLTTSHVDVVLPLATASLAVRRAGLDADPGWLPWAGRVVLFHYR